MAEKFSVQAVFTAVDQFSGPVSRMSDTLNKFNGKGGALGGKGNKLDTTFRDAGAAMGRMGERARNARNTIATVGVAGGFMAHKLITAGASVESALLAGSSKFGDGVRRNTPVFKELESAAFDLGKTTKFGAVEAAGALNDLAASGFDPAAAMKNLPIIAKMAIAGGEELQQASTIALDSMGVFGMLYDQMGQLRGPDQLASNLTRVADVMAYTANQTTASMGSIYETLTEAGKITDVAGMTFEKFAAITGALAQAGIKGSVAGTAIKNITVRLLSPTTEGSKELKKLKIDEKSFRKMTDPLEQLEVIAKAINQLPKEDKVKALDEYFGKIPLAAASYLASTGFRNARELESKILRSAPGSNARQAEIIADSTETKMAKLENTFERIGKTIFDKIQSPLEETIDKAVKYLDNNENKIANTAKSAVEWVGDNGDGIGTALKWAGGAWLASTAAGLIHSGVTLAGDIAKIGKGAVGLVTRVGAAAVAADKFVATVSMGRLGLGVAAGGAALGAAAAGAAVTTGGAYWLNSGLKNDTEGLGLFDIAGLMIGNALTGKGPIDPAEIVSRHQDTLARKRYLEDVKRQKMYANDGPLTAYDAALANSQYGDLTADPTSPVGVTEMVNQLSNAMQVEPLEVPPEAITVKPIDVSPIFDAIAAQIAASGPGVVGTEDKTASANQDWFGIKNQTDVNVSVAAEKGSTARAETKHTKPNNHRTGTN